MQQQQQDSNVPPTPEEARQELAQRLAWVVDALAGRVPCLNAEERERFVTKWRRIAELVGPVDEAGQSFVVETTVAEELEAIGYGRREQVVCADGAVADLYDDAALRMAAYFMTGPFWVEHCLRETLERSGAACIALDEVMRTRGLRTMSRAVRIVSLALLDFFGRLVVTVDGDEVGISLPGTRGER